MKPNKSSRPRRSPPKTTKSQSQKKLHLRLFVAGATTRSDQAIRRVQTLCAAQLKGTCQLVVIDIYQQPALARANQIVATPTLIIEFPKPVRRFIGNLANADRLFDEPTDILSTGLAS